MLLADLVATSEAVGATTSRLAKAEALAALLRRLEPAEVGPAVAFLSGEPRQRPLGVGWAALRDLPAPAAAPALTVADADRAFEALAAAAGPGSQGVRRDALQALFGAATEREQRFLRALALGDLRQGALGGVAAEAVAKAAAVPAAAVRRALMLRGALGPVAETALRDGEAGLRAFGLVVGRPLQPMLAAPAPDIATALERIRPAAVEHKLDGARLQVHRDGADVAVFTRSLDEITARVPEVVAAVRALPARRARPRRRGDRAARRRAPGALPGHGEPPRELRRAAGRAAVGGLLRRPAPRRRGPARRAGRGALRGAGRRAAGRAAGAARRSPRTPRRPRRSSRARSRAGTRA